MSIILNLLSAVVRLCTGTATHKLGRLPNAIYRSPEKARSSWGAEGTAYPCMKDGRNSLRSKRISDIEICGCEIPVHCDYKSNIFFFFKRFLAGCARPSCCTGFWGRGCCRATLSCGITVFFISGDLLLSTGSRAWALIGAAQGSHSYGFLWVRAQANS